MYKEKFYLDTCFLEMCKMFLDLHRFQVSCINFKGEKHSEELAPYCCVVD